MTRLSGKPGWLGACAAVTALVLALAWYGYLRPERVPPLRQTGPLRMLPDGTIEYGGPEGMRS